MHSSNGVPAKAENTLVPQAQTSAPRRILVADDDASIRRFTIEALTQAGYAVDAAEDGAAAWNALQLNGYDLLITDNTMPEMTGVELLEKIHAVRMTLPIIMATGAVPAEFTRFPWLQPAAVLLKPFTVEEMVRTVKAVLHEANHSQLSIDYDMNNYTHPLAAKPVHAPTLGPVNYHRILVVDEDRDLQRLYTEALTRPGYTVDIAGDGEAGWEALQTKKYNLLITENDIPKLSGVELVEKLRAAQMALPVVMAAGRLPEHELARNPSLQLAATLAKPFAVETLLDTVSGVLRATDSPSPRTGLPDGQDHWPTDGSQL